MIKVIHTQIIQLFGCNNFLHHFHCRIVLSRIFFLLGLHHDLIQHQVGLHFDIQYFRFGRHITYLRTITHHRKSQFIPSGMSSY